MVGHANNNHSATRAVATTPANNRPKQQPIGNSSGHAI